jgi:tRNA-splicing ligase RtcB
MAKLQLQGKDLRKTGYPDTPAISIAIQVMHKHFKHHSHKDALSILKKVLDEPAAFTNNDQLAPIAIALLPKPVDTLDAEISMNKQGIPFNVFGGDFISPEAYNQMYLAAKLPIAVAGALMPDAHSGYGLPIGGVLAADNAVIPYGVGVDIGCRMCLSVFPLPEKELDGKRNMFKNILVESTLFGSGGAYKQSQQHEVLERSLFREIPFLNYQQGKAARQLGTSGAGNHFVEFGIVEVTQNDAAFGLPEGRYAGLLSHSGSRGLGAAIAQHYTKLAISTRRLEQTVKHLAWLSLDEEAGQEYWLAMNLAGDYAAACHHTIHDKIARALGVKASARIENHHNFAWKEIYEGREVIVHRKGATPAGAGVLGIIPGSMTMPGFIVKGKGAPASVNSASHGAGRRMSRAEAKNSISGHAMNELLDKHSVTLIGGGIDEAPQAYKDIYTVMNAQKHLVDTIGLFYPRIVRMDGSKEQ